MPSNHLSPMPSNHLTLCRPLLLLPSIPPSIRVFSNESALCIGWPKYWSFSFSLQVSICPHIIEKTREFQKNIYLSFIDYTKAFDGGNHNKLWKILKEMEILDHLTRLLKNLYCRSRIQFSPVTQSCQTHYNPMDCSMPGFPVHHQLPDLSQTLVHQVSDPIQPSHPLSSPLLLPSVFPRSEFVPMSQFFISSGQSFGVSASASVLPKDIQD